MDPINTIAHLPKFQLKQIQQVVGTILYYAQAIDNTMLIALSTITIAQSSGIKHTVKALHKFFNDCATHAEAAICFCASPMILCIHSNTSNLSKPQAWRQAGGYFYLGAWKNVPDQCNGPILATTGIMKVVLSSAAEAETNSIFTSMKEGTILHLQ